MKEATPNVEPKTDYFLRLGPQLCTLAPGEGVTLTAIVAESIIPKTLIMASACYGKIRLVSYEVNGIRSWTVDNIMRGQYDFRGAGAPGWACATLRPNDHFSATLRNESTEEVRLSVAVYGSAPSS